MKKILKILLLKSVCVAAAYAECENKTQPNCCNYLLAEKGCSFASNSSGLDYSLDLDILMLQARQDQLQYGIKNSSATLLGTFLQSYQGRYLYPKFTWDPAVRFSFALFTNYDGWKVKVSTSYFSTSSNNTSEQQVDSSNIDGPGIMPTVAGASPILSLPGGQTSARWGKATAYLVFDFNDIDLSLYRGNYISRKLLTDIGFGLKTAWIRQNYNVRYSGGNQAEVVGLYITAVLNKNDVLLSNHSFSVGPMYFLDTNWKFAEQWRVLANAKVALLATHFHSIRKDYSVSDTSTLFQLNTDAKYWTFRPMAQLAMGLGWDYCLACPKTFSKVGATLLYEGQCYYKQNEWIQNVGGFGGFFPAQTNLILHGFSLNLSATF